MVIISNIRRFLLQITYGIQRKMFLLFSALSLMLIIALGLVASEYATRAITQTILANLQDKSQYISNTLDNYVGEMKNTVFVYSGNTGLVDFLANNFHDDTERYLAFKNLNNTAQSMVAQKKYCELYVIIPDMGYIYSTDEKSTMNQNNSQYIDSFVSEFTDETILGSITTEKFSPPTPLADTISFTVIQALPYIGSAAGDNKCYIVMTSSEKYFTDMFKNIRNEDSSDFVLITNDDLDIIYSNMEFTDQEIPGIQKRLQELDTGSGTVFSADFQEESYFGYVNQSGITSWKVYFLSKSSVVKDETAKINIAIMTITAVICLLMLIVSYSVSRSITTPLRKLKQIMKAVEKGNLSITADIKNNDETGELSKGFNQMIARINNLVNEVLASHIYQKEAELYALQQQINPHFLYNTLGAINSLANMEKYMDIRYAVQKLAEIFRYTISRNPSEQATIEDELQHANNYIAIQKLRFPDKIKMTVEMEESVVNTHVPRLILQPVIENCIEHTIAKQPSGSISIVVKGKVESPGTISISIHDDGPGIPREKLQEIRASLESDDSKGIDHMLNGHVSIGLFNVNARLKWMQREEFGLQLFSDGSGTTVILRLPNNERKEKESHVQISNRR